MNTMSTMAENVIASGSENRPHMLEKSHLERFLFQELQPHMLQHTYAKELWDRVKLLMEGSELSLQERESNLYNEFDKFTSEKDVKLAKDMHNSNFDQLYAYLRQHEAYANEVRMIRQRFPDPLALVANSYNTPPQQQFYSPPFHQQSYQAPLVYQQAYEAPVVHHQSPTVCPQLDSGLTVPKFLPIDDPIENLNKAMTFLSTAITSRYP
ncbi:hypothetical protein Tco_0144515 [Tanacetum coccineum]